MRAGAAFLVHLDLHPFRDAEAQLLLDRPLGSLSNSDRKSASSVALPMTVASISCAVFMDTLLKGTGCIETIVLISHSRKTECRIVV